MIRSRVLGTGRCLPEKVLTNFDLESMLDTTDEWIRKRTGIRERRVVENGVGTSDLGAPAAQRALEAAGVDPLEVDLIVCCTTTPDHVFPASAPLIQERIGAHRAAAYDVNAVCTGFVYGLATADAFIRSGVFRTVLVVGADILSNRINWKQREVAVLFGDGAGAVVLRGEEGERGVLTTYLAADGRDAGLLGLLAGGSKMPITPENANGPVRDMVMNGRELFKRAVMMFGNAAEKALAGSGYTADDLDLFVPHQANWRIIQVAAERIGLPMEKVFVNVDRFGNTTAASIPIALDDAVEQGRLNEGSLVMLAAFGAGLTWGSAMIRW